MNVDAIVIHLQENGIAYFVGAMVLIPLAVVFRKHVVPFFFHVFEYLLYCLCAHLLIAGLVRTFSWFRSETAFKNFDGSLRADFRPLSTPVSIDFWRQELYSPEWLFWFEVGVAVLLLYVVIWVRPVKFKNKTYQSKRPKPGELSSNAGTAHRYSAGAK